MAEHKVTCPQCHSTLKSGRPIPAGMSLKCPRCGLLFSAPQRAALAPASVAAAVAAPPRPAAAVPVGVAAAPYIPLPPAPPPAPPGRRGAALLVIGGSGFLVVLAAGLIYLCFSGDTSDPTTPPNDSPPPAFGGPPGQAKPKPPPPPLIVLSPEEQKKVDAAVARGVEFLKQKQQPNGTWNYGHADGLTALAGLTLLECGVKTDDDAIQRAAQHIRAAVSRNNNSYELSTMILFLHRLGAAEDRERIKEMALRLVASQTPAGGWDYYTPALSNESAKKLHTLLEQIQHRDPLEVRREWEERNEFPQAFEGLPVVAKVPLPGRRDDNSITQFAVLALWAARTQGVPVDRTLALTEKRFRTTQSGDGSWAYHLGNHVSPILPTMTCSGLLGLAVGYGLEKDAHKKGAKPEEDPQIKKALERLAKHIGEPSKPGEKAPAIQLYFLWSVERVAMLYQLKTIEGQPWYHWGMDILLTHQRNDGGWRMAEVPDRNHQLAVSPGENEVHDTCFALLFLRRVNLAKDLTDKLHELRARHGQAAAPSGKKN